MGKKYSGRRPEDQPMYTKPTQLDFEKRRLFITAIAPGVNKLLSFLGLSDTPSSYSGQGGKVVKVNSGETALEFGLGAGSGVDIILDGGDSACDIVDTSVLIVDLGDST